MPKFLAISTISKMSRLSPLHCIAVLSLLAITGCERSPFSELSESPLGNTLVCPFEGTEVLFQVEDNQPVPEMIEETVNVVWARLDNLGIDGASATRKETQILVQRLPSSDPQQMVQVISSMAQLEFRPQQIDTEAQFVTEYTLYQELLAEREQLQNNQNETTIAALFEPSKLTGARVRDAYPNL